MAYLVLRARPRVAPFTWPHVIVEAGRKSIVEYEWVTVTPNGWSTLEDPSCLFPEDRLASVIESFFDSVGPWPFDFEVEVRTAPALPLKPLAIRRTRKPRKKKP